MINLFKRFVKHIFRVGGFELKRVPGDSKSKPLPDLIEDPFDALLLQQSGKKIAFNCPVELSRNEIGFSYSPNGWHPFVATLRQYRENSNLTYDDSILKKYFETFIPLNAAEAIAGFNQPPEQFYDLPSYCIFQSPWTSKTPESILLSMEKYTAMDNQEHGRPDLQWDTHGLKHFGPVARDKGILEFSRLINIYNTLKKEGYNRSYGEIGAFMIRKGKEFRFLIGCGGGNHRAAAMAALGYEFFPAQYRGIFYMANTHDVSHWPLVQSGLWTERQAIAYVDHLFNFDSSSWAESSGLNKYALDDMPT